MTERIIRIIVEEQPVLYEELMSAMITQGEHVGCRVEQYTEYHEGGRTLAKFTLRKRDPE